MGKKQLAERLGLTAFDSDTLAEAAERRIAELEAEVIRVEALLSNAARRLATEAETFHQAALAANHVSDPRTAT